MWAVIPSTCCPSAPVSGDSTSASVWRSMVVAPFATLNGKVTVARYWRLAWKTERWTRLLFGRIYEPSTARLGVESWIASLAATRANRSPSPASGRATKTPDTSGRTSHGSSARSSPSGASSRTSPTTYEWALNKSTMTFSQWVTALRRVCLQRRKSARLTSGNASSSWPTPNVPNGGRMPRRGTVSPTGKSLIDGKKRQVSLEQAVDMFPTPIARDWRSASGSESVFQRNSLPLNEYVKLFPTPRAIDGRPKGNGPRPDTLTGRMTYDDQKKVIGQLNPTWVDWLMGWPLGWTACEPVATEWSHWLQLMRGELLRLLCMGDL